MEFGIFHEFWSMEAASQAAAFAESFTQIEAAESWGLDAVWVAEIHMNPQRALSTAPLTLAAAIAARTRRIKIGTAVQILPLGHPLRLAEETATIDQISGGRLIFGVGRSAFPRAYNAYGISYEESQDRFAESLDIVKKAWTEPTTSHHGHYYNFDNFTLVPRPVQQPHPPIRVAASQHDTYSAIGHLGYPLFSAVRASPLGELPETRPRLPRGVARGRPPGPRRDVFAGAGLCGRNPHRRAGRRRGRDDAVFVLPRRSDARSDGL